MFASYIRVAIRQLWIVVSLILIATLQLAGCGGGGGGGGGQTNPVASHVASAKTFPIDLAISNLVRKPPHLYAFGYYACLRQRLWRK